MQGDHYFSSQPTTPAQFREFTATLADKERALVTANGIFSPDHIDRGTEVLLKHMPRTLLTGNLLDLGSGWGPIALTMALIHPQATIWAVDVNTRALEVVEKNAQRLQLQNIRPSLPEDVPDDIRFQAIRSNPPIRVGKNELHKMLIHWIKKLQVNAEGYFVVQKNLGSDSLLNWMKQEFTETFHADRFANEKGFRVLRVKRITE